MEQKHLPSIDTNGSEDRHVDAVIRFTEANHEATQCVVSLDEPIGITCALRVSADAGLTGIRRRPKVRGGCPDDLSH